jgi:hypothetical protein
MKAPSASLRSEDDAMKRAVEMTPHGKSGKLKSQSEFSTLSTGLGNPAQVAGFPHFHRADGGFTPTTGEEDGAEIEFQLTDPGHFKHHKHASVAALRM